MLKRCRALRQVNIFEMKKKVSQFNVSFTYLLSLSVFNESSIQNRLVAGATVLIVFIVVLAIVATVLVLRTKNQDDLDKKTSNHLPLPLDYASNEGLLSVFCSFDSRSPPHVDSFLNLFLFFNSTFLYK